MKLIVFLFSFACLLSALAQSYTVQEPGKLPTYVRSTSSGVTITKPGQLPTTVRSTYGGGATISTPGQLPVYMRPTYGGGSTVTIRPSYGSSTTTAAQVAAYLYPVTKPKEKDEKISHNGKRQATKR